MTDQKNFVIDLAGAMEKATPEMMDKMRDIIIYGLVKRCEEMLEALKPFATGSDSEEDRVRARDIVNEVSKGSKAARPTITVDKESLLAVVRKLDIGATCNAREFNYFFDKLRAAFTPDEIATGRFEGIREPKRDPRPAECRKRLMEEGNPYLRSSCKACGTSIRTNMACLHGVT